MYPYEPKKDFRFYDPDGVAAAESKATQQDPESAYLGQLANETKSVSQNNKADFLAYMERLKAEADDAYQKQLLGMDAKAADAKQSDSRNSAFHGVLAGVGQMLGQPAMYQSEAARAQKTPEQDQVMKLRKEALDYAQQRYNPEKLAAGYLTSQGQDVTAQGQKMSSLQTLANQEGQRAYRQQQSEIDKARLQANIDDQNSDRALSWSQLNETKRKDKEQEALEKQKIDQKYAVDKAKANAAITGKTMPPEALNHLSSIEAAEGQIEALSKLWDEKASKLGSSITGNIPDTDANLYDKQLKSFVQSIGVGLEGGKLTDRDMPKYEAMMPKKTSTKAQKEAMINALREQAKIKRAAIISAHEQAGGFNLTGFKTGQIAPADRSSPMRVRNPQTGETAIVHPNGLDQAIAAGFTEQVPQ